MPSHLNSQKKISICQSNYIPWKGYFEMIRQSDVFVLYDEVQYTKGDWRNRNLIKTKDGLQWLTVPVSAHLSSRITEVHAVNHVWRKKHWNALLLNYKKTDCFLDYSPFFEELYNKLIETNLSFINQAFIELICKLLGITTQIVRSEEIPRLAQGRTERLVEIVKHLKGNVYLSGPKAKAYLDESLLKAENIGLSWMEYGHFPEYNQSHPPFVHNVTVLDLIFNQGPEAMSFMQNHSLNETKYS